MDDGVDIASSEQFYAAHKIVIYRDQCLFAKQIAETKIRLFGITVAQIRVKKRCLTQLRNKTYSRRQLVAGGKMMAGQGKRQYREWEWNNRDLHLRFEQIDDKRRSCQRRSDKYAEEIGRAS